MQKDILTALLILFGISYCCSCSEDHNKNSDNIKFRLLPASYTTTYALKKPSRLILYAIETSKDTADKQLITKTDSFLCEQLKDSINPKNYSSLVIWFLKETELTKKFKSSEITDAHNPVSSEHFMFLEYDFLNEGEYFSRKINDAKRREEKPLPCELK